MDEPRPLGKPTEFDRRAEPIVCLAAGGVPLLAGPLAAVTREQMAAFLRRLAEAEVVKAATALTADNAGTAGHATSADTAAFADSAGSADTAVTAGHATTADSATNAASANMATTADSAAESELLAGREPGR